MLISSFELLLKPQFSKGVVDPKSPISNLSRTVIQAYFLTISNVNTFDVTVALEFTIRFPIDSVKELPTSFKDLIDAVDITGTNLIPPKGNDPLVPELVNNNKARLTFTIPSNATSLLVLQPDFINNLNLLQDANFEARGYAEISIISLSGSETATLLVTPQLRGTFFKDLNAKDFPDFGLDQIAYDLPVKNGGVFEFSNS
jgi:hypothetical protein